MRILRLVLLSGGLAACQPATTRPWFAPAPEAPATEVRLPVTEAVQRLAEALRADSIPLARVTVRDGYLESGWFHAASKRRAERPLGPDVVRVRAWADPGRPGFTVLTAETMHRPLADPSLPERELERTVPQEHPIATRVRAALDGLVERYGGPPRPAPPTPRAAPPGRPEAGEEELPEEEDAPAEDLAPEEDFYRENE